ncbi:MAG: transcription termination/antitermination protein NusA [Firmicutes bacterium]|jgi:N utilization substance protein A|nr:transcription termination/antitermination protein NusA [Bacillota bacterium]
MDRVEFINALNQIEKEKGIDKEVIFEAIETSLVSACKKNFGTSQNIKVVINRETGDVACYAQKEVVEEVEDKMLQISLEDARNINPYFIIGDIIDIEVTPKNFGRISAQTAKQVVVQKFREAEREILYNQYITKEKDIMTGIVQRRERKNVIVQLGKIDAILTPNEQIPFEEYNFMDRIKVYVLEVKQSTKGPQIYVSRTHPELVKRLFEQEVPEVYDGTVEIKSIAREAGSRTKIAVYTKDKNVDALGACVGQNGYRVNVIVNELHGEKIDVINWSEDPKEFIAAALSPSKVVAVSINEQEQSAKIVVPDHQLSLAIGKEGQNARLSAKLTGWRIDIKSETQAKETNFLEYDEIHMNLVENKQENETESEQERMLRLCQEAFADLEEPEEKQEIDEISEEIENNISEQFDEMIE